jgi:hypothetical protein
MELGALPGPAARGQALRRSFAERLGSIECAELAGGRFGSPADLADHLAGGGCPEVIQSVAELIRPLST